MIPNVPQPQPLGGFSPCRRLPRPREGGSAQTAFRGSYRIELTAANAALSCSASNKLFLGGLSWTTTEGKLQSPHSQVSDGVTRPTKHSQHPCFPLQRPYKSTSANMES